MEWIAEEVSRLRQLVPVEPRAIGGLQSLADRVESPLRHQRMRAFLDAVRRAVAQIALRDGVTACFACHEGLVLDAAGSAADFEALSAVSQLSAATSVGACERLDLGAVSQMVIIGAKAKLALIQVGPVTLGIVAPSAISLSRALG